MKDKEMFQERGMVKLDIEESAGSYLVFINDIRINKNKPLSTSKTVMSFNCPKKYILQAIGIPEGSVVLSKEEWEKYQITQRDYNATYFDGIYQARKETAREILKEVTRTTLFDNKKECGGKLIGYLLRPEDIKNLEELYQVQVEE